MTFCPVRARGGQFLQWGGSSLATDSALRRLARPTQRHQFDYTIRRLALRAVEATAAPNANSQLQAVDATAVTKQMSQVAAVAITSADVTVSRVRVSAALRAQD